MRVMSLFSGYGGLDPEHQVWQGAWMIALCHLWPIWLIGWIAATIHSKRSRKENAK